MTDLYKPVFSAFVCRLHDSNQLAVCIPMTCGGSLNEMFKNGLATKKHWVEKAFSWSMRMTGVNVNTQWPYGGLLRGNDCDLHNSPRQGFANWTRKGKIRCAGKETKDGREDGRRALPYCK